MMTILNQTLLKMDGFFRFAAVFVLVGIILIPGAPTVLAVVLRHDPREYPN